MNALIFLVPEDIVDVRPRLVSCHHQSFDEDVVLTVFIKVLTFVGSLMALK